MTTAKSIYFLSMASSYVPCVTVSSIVEPVSCAMKPITAKITKPAKTDVLQFRIGRMHASL